MKVSLIVLALFCFILVVAGVPEAGAEEWKSVFETGAGKAYVPEKKAGDSGSFVVRRETGHGESGASRTSPVRLNIVLTKGYEASSRIIDREYRERIKDIFERDNVTFFGIGNHKMTKSQVLATIPGADIYIFSGHGGKIKSTNDEGGSVICLEVAPSADNQNLSSHGNSLLLPSDIRSMLAGGEIPRLAIFNACNGIKVGVKPENQLYNAFGIDRQVRGRAFISWNGSKAGFLMDEVLYRKLKEWSTLDSQKGYPTLREVFKFVNPDLNKVKGDMVVIGDPDLRFLPEYFVLYQLTFPQLRKEKKIKKREGETETEWQQRKKEYYQGLGPDDFKFVKIPLNFKAPGSLNPVIVKVMGDGGRYYSEEYFPGKSKFAMSINGTKIKDGRRVAFKGAFLLSRIGQFKTKEELLEAYPFLKKRDDEGKLVIRVFNREDGREGRHDKAGDKEHFVIGPIREGWSKKDKEDAVALAKSYVISCFIAHAVYDDSEARPINVFREFRDKILSKSPAGTHLIRLYYEYGPGYAVKLKNNPEYIPYVRWCMDKFANFLEKMDLDNSEESSAELQWLAELADKVVSVFFREGESDGDEWVSRITMPPSVWPQVTQSVELE